VQELIVSLVAAQHPFDVCRYSDVDAGRSERMAARRVWEGGDFRLSKVSSEYIKSNVWMTFQDDLTAFNSLHQMPHTQLLWTSDFPHTDSTWPRSQQLLAEHTAHLQEEQRQAIMRENAARLFQLDAGTES
jgi:uncharacterized protein